MGQPDSLPVELDEAGNPVDEAPTPGVDLDNGHDPDEEIVEGESDADALDAEAPHEGENAPE
jgi:hypothetical protein